MQPRVIWVERTGFQNAFDMFRNEPSSDDFKCLSPVNVIGTLSCPANINLPFVAICGISPGGRFFQTIYGVASRSCRSPSLAFPQERRSTLSHCVAKPLAQLNGCGVELGFQNTLQHIMLHEQALRQLSLATSKYHGTCRNQSCRLTREQSRSLST